MAEDARVRKTKQKLSAALVALLQEKAFSDITPAQICEKAGINRSTFYRNYKNILQLKTEMENKILAGIQWSSLPTDSFSAKEKIEAQLGYLKENKDYLWHFPQRLSGKVSLIRYGNEPLRLQKSL